jgi:SAM-dependent methyltransferase
MAENPSDGWTAGDAYERYMGRWSRSLARSFLDWLAPRAGAHWLEVGCGTGALTATILERCGPATIVACDPSPAFVEHARKVVTDPRASIVAAGAEALPRRDDGFDFLVSGLVFNFIPKPEEALVAMKARTRSGGTIAAYVWDYTTGLEFLRHFWDEAVAANPAAAELDEARRFGQFQPPLLESLFRGAGLAEVRSEAVEIPTTFENFDDFWTPFLAKTGPAPAYVASLSEGQRQELKERLEKRVPTASDGRIALRARAWAVRGRALAG